MTNTSRTVYIRTSTNYLLLPFRKTIFNLDEIYTSCLKPLYNIFAQNYQKRYIRFAHEECHIVGQFRKTLDSIFEQNRNTYIIWFVPMKQITRYILILSKKGVRKFSNLTDDMLSKQNNLSEAYKSLANISFINGDKKIYITFFHFMFNQNIWYCCSFPTTLYVIGRFRVYKKTYL